MDSQNTVHAILIASQFNQATEKTLESLRAQAYSNLAVSLVDIANTTHEEFSGLKVHKSYEVKNYSAGINLALKEQSEEADFILLLSEDVVLDGVDTVKELVAEANNSGATVVGAKMVLQNDTSKLVEVGVGIDKTGTVASASHYGELDQGQYDIASPVFATRKDCMLISREIFIALNGFDSKIKKAFGDIDFCWRVHLAGGTVRVAPKAVCLVQNERDAQKSQFLYPDYFYQLRMIFSCYGIGSLFLVLPRTFFVALFGLISNLAKLSLRRAFFIFFSWVKIFFTLFGIFKKREQIRRQRHIGDSTIKNLQDKGFVPVTSFFRDGGFSLTNIRKLFHGRGAWVTWAGIIAVLVFGSRHLITQVVPQVGELLPFQSHFFDDWFSTQQASGLGGDGYSSNAGLWLGIFNAVFFGADALARTAFIFAIFVVGAWGVWYLLNQIANRAASKAIGTITYLLIPLPYIALSKGDLEALILYACAPWIFSFLIKHLVHKGHIILQSLFLGLTVGFIAGFSIYIFALLVFLMAVALLASFISGVINFKSIAVGVAGGILGIILNFTYLFSSRGVQLWEWRPTSARNYNLHDIMSFNLSELSLGYLAWGFVGAAFFLLLLAKEKRSMWMVYGWVLYLGGVVVAWSAEQGWHNFASQEVLLIPASLGLAVALGMGADVLNLDVAKKLFGWGRFAIYLASLAFLAAAMPVLTLSLDGRWDLPQSDYATTYESINSSNQRVLWIGHPDVIGASSWQLNDEVAFSITQSATPDITAIWSPSRDENVELVQRELSQLDKEDRIGAKLAFFGIGHIILVEKFHPTSQATYPIGSRLHSQFESQLDLEQLNTRDGIKVFANNQVIPIRANLPSGALENETLSSNVPIEVFADSNTENITAGNFYLADASPNWEFQVEGQKVEPEVVFNWAKQYLHNGGSAKLTYNSTALNQLILIVQVLIWVMFISFAALEVRRVREKYR